MPFDGKVSDHLLPRLPPALLRWAMIGASAAVFAGAVAAWISVK